MSWVTKPLLGPEIQDMDPLQFAQTTGQFGIVAIPMLRIQNDFSGPELLPTDAEISGVLPKFSQVYPMKLLLSHLRGK